VNLLTYSEQFDNAAWTKGNGTITPNAIASPDGTLTADKLVENTATGQHRVHKNSSGTTNANPYTVSFFAKAGERTKIYVGIAESPTFVRQGNAVFDLAAGTVASTHSGNGGATGSVAAITAFPNGWYRCSYTLTLGGTDTTIFYDIDIYTSSISYTGDGTSGLYLWGAQLEESSTATRYQRITTATDYDTVGFPHGDKFDGVDDALATAAGGGATTAFFWCSSIAVGKIGAAQTLFSDTGTNTGYLVRINAGNQLELSAGDGAAYTTIATVPTLAVGQRAVLTAWDDGVNLNVQIDNGAVASVARPAVSAGTAAITIGKDNGAASSFFLGSIYEKIYVKDDVQTASQIASAKTYCAQKAGVTL
jgi:hypothetical protein